VYFFKELEKVITKYDEKVVDLDDEHNSAYMIKTRLVNLYVIFGNFSIPINW